MSSSLPLHYRFWAKADTHDRFHLLSYHNLDVAAVAHVLLANDRRLRKYLSENLNLSEGDVQSLLVMLLAWHDIGKFSVSFQNLRPDLLFELLGLRADTRYVLRHDTAGWRLFQRSEIIRRDILSGNNPIFNGCSDSLDTQDVIEPLFRAIFGHHGTPPDALKNSTISTNLYPDLFEKAATQYLTEVRELLSPSSLQITSDETYTRDREAAHRIAWVVAGFSVICDWTGSNSFHFPYQNRFIPLVEYWKEHALPQAEKAVAALDLLPKSPRGFGGLRNIFQEIPHLTPLQMLCESLEIPDEPQLFIVEDTTGAGKTEAAVTLAHRLLCAGHGQGVYFALPTMATANGVFERTKPIFRRLFEEGSSPSLVLSHSRRDLNPSFIAHIGKPAATESATDGDEPGEVGCAAWFADSRKKALLSSFGVGTIDQALVGVLPIRHQSLRLFGLSRDILIIDEIHAYDSYVSELICKLLHFHASFGASAIVLSATLPKALKQQFTSAYRAGLEAPPTPDLRSDNPYPSLDQIGRTNQRRFTFETRQISRRVLKINYTDDQAIVLSILREAVAEGRCVCWMRNSIDDARCAFDLVRKEGLASKPPILFHSRFCHGDRQRIEEHVLRSFGPTSSPAERQGQIIIATQVVEQSLDLDFDVVISDLAPIDLIIQRAGRLMRHPRTAAGACSTLVDERGTPIMHVFGPPLIEHPDSHWYETFSKTASFVYPHHGRLYLTAKLLVKAGSIRVPEDFRSLIETVYGSDSAGMVPPQLSKREQRAEGEDLGKASIAALNSLNLKDGYISQGSAWSPDVDTPTRLSNEQITVTLATRSAGVIKPIVDGLHGWELSEIALPRLVAPLDTAGLKDTFSEEVERLKKTNPRLKWKKFVYVSPELDYLCGQLVSRATGDIVRFKYHPASGLELID